MRLDENDEPDWSYWQLVPTVTLFEAVSLSLNIDPRRLVPHPAGGGSAGIAIARIPPPGFYNRLDLGRRCVGETLPAAEPRHGEEHVRLPSFTEWATGLGWSVPPELHDMAADNGSSPLEAFSHDRLPAEMTVDLDTPRTSDDSYQKSKQRRCYYASRLEVFMATRLPPGALTDMSARAITDQFVGYYNDLNIKGKLALPHKRYIDEQVEKLRRKIPRQKALNNT
jgi:hypothetical protein